MASLDGYTHHGESITVPDLRGRTITEIDRMFETLKLSYTIMDSSYLPTQPPNSILEQEPPPGARVKENRRIYLTINASLPPRVKMPNLVDKSLRQAQMELEVYGLNLGELQYRPDLALNAVLDQMYLGKHILPGTLIHKNSTIDLVLGNGLGETQVTVPNLTGLTFAEAKWTLLGTNLNIGHVEWDVTITDSATAVVYRQIPEHDNESQRKLNFGEAVDIHLTQTLPDFLKQFSVDPADSLDDDYDDE